MTLTGHLGLDGTMEMRRTLPDEEVFESLAARVRPLLVKSESIHYSRVIDAVRSSVEATTMDVPTELTRSLDDLRSEWSRLNLDGREVLRFAVQASQVNQTWATPQVSDTQLAAAWLYGDVVHVDTRGHKSEGQLFPVKERYSAAVTYFAHAALLSLLTMDLVLALHELGVIELSHESLEADVIVGQFELVDEGVAYIGPIGSTMPELDTIVNGTVPDEFHQLSVTELLRQNSSNEVQVLLTAGDGSIVSEYEAAVTRRGSQEGRLLGECLVAGAVTIQVSFGVQADRIEDAKLESITSGATTNRLKLAEALLGREMEASDRMSFYVNGQLFFSMDLPQVPEEETAFTDISIDTLYDLVVIENITHRALAPLTGSYRSHDRGLLRRARLLWEGEVVPFGTGPLRAESPAGVVPKVVIAPAHNLQIGDSEFPVPETCIRHSQMSAESATAIPDRDPPVDTIEMVVPSGEVFAAWAPGVREVRGDQDLTDLTPWGLSHFDL